MNHIPDIIKYLKQKEIIISSPAFTSFDDYSSGVTLADRNFSVTIIIPRSLMDNRDIVRLTRLDPVR